MSLAAPSTVGTSSAMNFERSTLSAQSSMRFNFGAELLARAHPPYPPGGGAQTSPPARTFSARFKFALKVRETDHGMVPSRQRTAAEARGNSAQSIHSLFRLSGRDWATTWRAPLGRGRTDAAWSYPTTFPPPRWPLAAFLGVWGPTPGPRTARSTLTRRFYDEH